MKPEHIKVLADAAMYREFEPNEWICHEDDPSNRFYLICTGKVALETRRYEQIPLLTQFVCEGDELGWLVAVSSAYLALRCAGDRADDGRFLLRHAVRAICDEDPAFGYELMKRIAAAAIKSLQISRAQLMDLQAANALRMAWANH